MGSVALVATLGLGVAACSEDSSGTDPTSSSDESTDESTDQSTDESTDAGEEETADAESEEAEAPDELSADDFFPTVLAAFQDAETFRFSSTTTTGGATQEGAGEGRFTEDGAQLKASVTGAQDVDMILVDQVLYLQSPQLGTGEKWMKLDLRKEKNPLLSMLAKMTDPQALLEAMESPKKLELLGTDDVDGVTANHYRITIDSKQYAVAMGLPAAMGSFLPDQIVQDMWVDAENRPLKYFSEFETPAVGGSKPTKTTTEGYYTDFGADVEIEAPPASEITDAAGLPGAA
jgi:hypothetical protein